MAIPKFDIKTIKAQPNPSPCCPNGVCRGVHGSGRSSLCPTHNRLVRDWVGRFSTRNWPIKKVGFRGSVCPRVASVLGEAETRRKTPKNGQNRRDLTRSGQDPVRISSNLMIFPPNRAENRRILLFWSPKSAKSSWKLVGIVGEFVRIWCLWAGRVSRVLNEGTRNRPTGVGFWSSGPVADHQNSRIGWMPIKGEQVGWVAGWVGQP